MLYHNIQIDWLRKPIRRLHLRVYPDGRVVVSSPWFCTREEVESFVQSHLDWIQKTRIKLATQPPRPALPIITAEQKEEVLAYLTKQVEWWRLQMGEKPITWKIRNMKTQWGNCRASTRQVTFNLQLARVPNELRDYIIVHELAHLCVPNHSKRFYDRVASYIPDWASRRQQLKRYIL